MGLDSNGGADTARRAYKLRVHSPHKCKNIKVRKHAHGRKGPKSHSCGCRSWYRYILRSVCHILQKPVNPLLFTATGIGTVLSQARGGTIRVTTSTSRSRPRGLTIRKLFRVVLPRLLSLLVRAFVWVCNRWEKLFRGKEFRSLTKKGEVIFHKLAQNTYEYHRPINPHPRTASLGGVMSRCEIFPEHQIAQHTPRSRLCF